MTEDRIPHYFYAISVPSNIQSVIKQQCRLLEDDYPFKEWVHESDYHITLTFLGAASSEVLAAMNQKLMEQLKGFSVFTLHLEDLHTFGNKERPRILWCGLHKESQLYQIQSIVHQNSVAYGFSGDKRQYTPHITLAKKWKGEQDLIYLPTMIKTPRSFEVNEVVLYQVHPDDRPKYKRIATFSLAN